MTAMMTEDVFSNKSFPKMRNKLWELENELNRVTQKKQTLINHYESLLGDIQIQSEQQVSNVTLQHTYQQKHKESVQLQHEVKKLLSHVDQLHNDKKAGMSMVADHNVILEGMISDLFDLEHNGEVFEHALLTKNNIIARMKKHEELLGEYNVNQTHKINSVININQSLLKNIKGFYILGSLILITMDSFSKTKNMILKAPIKLTSYCVNVILNAFKKEAK